MLKIIYNTLNKIFRVVGFICMILLFLTTLNIAFDVVMRYVFNDVSIGLQEMEWHLFSSMFLLGISYTIVSDGHVRVDFIYEKLNDRHKSIINMFGSIILIIPLAYLIIVYGYDFALAAFSIQEKSPDPGGLSYRFIIKSLIPLSFVLVILAAIQMFIKNLNIFIGSCGNETLRRRYYFDMGKESEGGLT